MASIKKRAESKYRAKPWRARYRDNANKEHAKHFATKGEAQALLDKETASLVRGDWVDPNASKTTYLAWSEDYFAGASSFFLNQSTISRCPEGRLPSVAWR